MASAKDIEEQAAIWLVAVEEGATPEQWQCQMKWLAANPKHRAAYLRLSHAWKHADALRQLRPLDFGAVDPDLLAHASRDLNPQAARPSWRDRLAWRRIAFGMAATLVGAVCGAVAWQAFPRITAPVHQSSFAGTERVTLPDGSRVHLNSDSVIRIDFTANRRNIELVRGEALFDVASDVRRPFQVSTGGTRASAAESRFAVRRRSDDVVEVMVAEGKVVFERRRLPLFFGGGGAGFTRVLWTGNRARANGPGLLVRNIGAEAVTRRLAWRNGQVAFLGETLEEAVTEINRYNRQALVIDDPEVAQRRVSGTFEATDPRSFLASLETALDVKSVRMKDRNIRLVSAKR